MIGHVRRVEQREALLVLRPREFAGVDDDAANAGAVAAHVLGQRMDDDVGAVFERPAEDGRRHRVVDDQWDAVTVRGVSQRLEIDDIAGRVADGLAEDCLGLVVDQRFQRGDVIVGGEAHLDALTRQGVGEKVVGAAIELGHRNDVIARFSDGLDRIGDRRHARSHRQRGDTAFQCGDTLFEHVGGGIHDARIDVARHLQIEEVGAMLGIVERIGRGLVDRHRHGLGCRVRAVARMNRQGLQFHCGMSLLLAGKLRRMRRSLAWVNDPAQRSTAHLTRAEIAGKCARKSRVMRGFEGGGPTRTRTVDQRIMSPTKR